MVQNARLISCALILGLLGGALGCQPPASEPLATDSLAVMASDEAPSDIEAVLPSLETYADSVAMRVYEASGGPAAWQALPYLGFNFSVMTNRERGRVVRHFWNRRTGDYRVEMPGPGSSPYVALFNVNTQQGKIYWEGIEIDPAEAPGQLEESYRRYINDTYWLAVPFKLFDPGVNRTYVPDSSDASYDVIHLSFGDVGLTPGDQYWLYVDKETGRLARWSYVLESFEPGVPPRSFVWGDYEEHVTPAGPLFFSTRKRGIWTPFAIFTDEISTPTASLVPDDIFTAPEQRLTPATDSE